VKTKFCSKYCFCLLICLLTISWHEALTQINFLKFPKNNQVLQRNDQNEAVLSVKGSVIENGHTFVSLTVLQDGNVFSQSIVNLDALKTFDFSPIIKAGKYNYTVKLYLDGTNEVKSATRVAVGDVFLIYGQSNALGLGGIESYRPASNPLIRYFNTFNYDNGESEWFLPFETYYWPGTGAMEFMKFLCEKYEYPVGVIEASVGGSDIKGLNNRNALNPTDKNTYYGKMLLQTDYSDLRNQIKYIIFRHGESDSYYPTESQAYPAEFDKLYNNLITDFSNLSKIYNTQVNILSVDNKKASFLSDFQRRTQYLYPKITTMSTVGTVGYDGLHYTLAGYSQTAFELSRIIGREVFDDNLSEQVYSPDLKRAYWENNKLVLAFDSFQQMVYPEDVLVNGFLYQMKNYIYLDGKNDVVQSGEAIGNKIYLTVTNANSSKLVSYLPSSFGAFGSQVYEGGHFKNALGMRAFSFANSRIDREIPEPIELSLFADEDIKIKLSWNTISDLKYHIERSIDNSNNFVEIATINGDNYFDTQVNLGKTYYYRIYADNASSTKSNIKDITLKCLENVNLKTFPNVSYVGANISILAIVTISNAKQLSLEAKKSIDLNPDFDAEFGSNFTAEIGGCKNN
jgi:hypothetical protein